MADTATLPPPKTANPPITGLRIDVQVPHDKHIPRVPTGGRNTSRNRPVRWVVLIALGLATLVLPIYFGQLWGSFIGLPRLGFLIGLGVAGILLVPLLVRSLVSNPEWTGYVTINSITGKNVPYGPGLHPALPWEQRNREGNYPLKVVTKHFDLRVQTKTSMLIIKGIFEYQVDLANISNNVGIDESTVDLGYRGFIETFLTARLAMQDAEQVREQVDDINGHLAEQFMGGEEKDSTIPEFETKNGIRTVAVAVTSLAMPPAVQMTRDAVDEAEKMFAIMAKLKGVKPEELRKMIADRTVSPDEEVQLRRAALATSGNAEMKIFEGNLSNLGAIGSAIGGGNNKH